MRPLIMRFALLTVAALFNVGALSQQVYEIRLDKPIHPVTEAFMLRALQEANSNGANLVMLKIDTPGGLVTSVEAIQRAILQSRAPVVAFVTPSGARATSGGAMVALACDLIAMAPGTSIGSAHPVMALPIPTPDSEHSTPPEEKGGEENKGEKAPSKDSQIMMQKVVNDLAAHMRSIAENRGRNAAAAESMIRETASFTEKEALEKGVIEMVARTDDEVFDYIATHPIKRFDGAEVVALKGRPGSIKRISMSGREKFLCSLADPNLAFIMLLLGALGLFVEFKAPGLIFPGVFGAILILLFFMSTSILPINVVGLLLVLLGIVFFILEIKVVSYGILTTGGVISLVVGGLMMYKEYPVPEMRISLGVLLPIAIAFAGILIFLLTLAAKALRNPVVTGKEAIVGQLGQVRQEIIPPSRGKVFLLGELWDAEASGPIEVGREVRVIAVKGMVLTVELT